MKGLDLGPGETEPQPDDENNYQGDLDMIRKTVNIRSESNANLKVLISVGGPEQSLQTFSAMAQDSLRRSEFVQSAVGYISKFDLDGLDLFWQYPSETDKPNFVQVMKVSTFNSLVSVGLSVK